MCCLIGWSMEVYKSKYCAVVINKLHVMVVGIEY